MWLQKQSITLCRLEDVFTWLQKIQYLSMQARGTRGCRNRVPLYVGQRTFSRGCRNRVPLLCRLEDTWLQKQSTTLCRPRGHVVVEIEYHSLQARGRLHVVCRKQSNHLCVGQRDVFTWVVEIQYLFMQARGHVVCRNRVPLYVGQRTRGCRNRVPLYVGQRDTWFVENRVPLNVGQRTFACVLQKQSTTLCRLEGRFHVVVENIVTSQCRLEDTWLLQKIE